MSNTLKEQLYQALVQGIDRGHLEPGLVLLEGNIAAIFDMSRSPVRQTLSRLHDEGKICRFDGRGYLVGRGGGEVIRRTLGAGDFRAAGGQASIQRTEAWQALAEKVERDLVLCSMKGRLELNELQLAKTYAVSRTTTQRILASLQSLGVVDKTKYSSWSVIPLDDERLHHLYDARRQLEPFMISRACGVLSDQELDGYLFRLDEAARQYPNLEGARLDALENDLHQEALMRGGNPEIITMLRRTRPILLISKHLLGGAVEMPAEDPLFTEHRRVFEALSARLPKQAGQALDEHLANAETKVRQRLANFREAGEVVMPRYLSWVETF